MRRFWIWSQNNGFVGAFSLILVDTIWFGNFCNSVFIDSDIFHITGRGPKYEKHMENMVLGMNFRGEFKSGFKSMDLWVFERVL